MYITDFRTPDELKKTTVRALEATGVEIIEVGFLKNAAADSDSAIYGSVGEMDGFIAPKSAGTLYAAIVMDFEELPPIAPRTERSVDCLRFAFFKKDADRILGIVPEIKEKGYHVMLQPMRTSDYSRDEICALIGRANELLPFSFAMVDSFGNMLPHDVSELCDLYSEHIDPSIRIGFHFHNNSQLAFANAIETLGRDWSHEIILDASVFGMGRGAGNLPVELICGYLNDTLGKRYDVDAIYDLYEARYSVIFDQTPWGYSHKHLISARHNVNPYYATYLASAYGVSARELNELFSTLGDDEKAAFRKAVADGLVKGRCG
jgi:4-hydroxy 2-oxovalerate aldolase